MLAGRNTAAAQAVEAQPPQPRWPAAGLYTAAVVVVVVGVTLPVWPTPGVQAVLRGVTQLVVVVLAALLQIVGLLELKTP
jgi:hypothetical protein